MPHPCPCGSGRDLDACCGRALRGVPPGTAEGLMRSRYVAFGLGRVDYLLETHHPQTRADVTADALRATCARCRYLGLDVIEVVGGVAGDGEGEVLFEARGLDQGRPFVHRERSRFVRTDGRWLYVDGDVTPAATPAPGKPVRSTQPAKPRVGRRR